MVAHVGLANNRFYNLSKLARDDGFTTIVSPDGLSSPFTTSRGIK